MSSKDIDWPLYRQIAGQAARKVARDYPGVDPEDIEQTIYVRTLENVHIFKRMNYGTAALFSVFVKYGTRYANDERQSNIHFSDQYHYTAKEVRALCAEALFDRDAFIARLEQRDADVTANPEEIIARTLDLQEAFAALTPKQQALLRSRYLDGRALTGSERKEATRAIDRLCLTINVGRSKRRYDHDGPGSRQVITNSAAQALTRKAYE